MQTRNTARKPRLKPEEYDFYFPICGKQDLNSLTISVDVNKDPCSICLGKLNAKPMRKVLLCSHLFHSECLLSWKNMHENCPNCKKDFSMKAIRDFEK